MTLHLFKPMSNSLVHIREHPLQKLIAIFCRKSTKHLLFSFLVLEQKTFFWNFIMPLKTEVDSEALDCDEDSESISI